MVLSKQLLTNLEDEIFLKGGSVVTPQNFNLVLLIKIFARKLKLLFSGFPFDFRTFLFFIIMEFLPQVKTFQIYYWTCLPFQEKHFLYQWNLFA